MIEWLQNWYKSQCNGDWEHDYGIKIETLDNPGWNVEIDLTGTGLNIKDRPWTLTENSNADWYGFKVENDTFEASGDPSKLEHLIKIFKDLCEREG